MTTTTETTKKNSSMTSRHSSETAEHYTPPKIVEAARALLGGIDLDPASCPKAQRVVQAKTWCGDAPLPDQAPVPGLWGGPNGIIVVPWYGRVFLNPPGGKNEDGKSNQKIWWQKLAQAWANGEVISAVFVCFSVELLQTTQVKPKGPIPLDFPICFPSRRVKYINEEGVEGTSPPHSSCIIYLPPVSEGVEGVRERLEKHFGWLGACK